MTTSIKSFKPIVLSFTKTILYSNVNPLLMFYFTKFDVYIWFQYKHSDDIFMTYLSPFLLVRYILHQYPRGVLAHSDDKK